MGNVVTEACQNFNFNHKSGGSEMVIQAALKDEDKAQVRCVEAGADGGGEELAWRISTDWLKHLSLR